MNPPASTPAAAGRPRILHCITRLQLGGAERLAVTLAAALRDRFDFALHAFQADAPDAIGAALRREISALGLPLSAGPRLPPKWGGLIPGALALGRTIDAFQPDLVHLHTEIPEAGYATLLALRPALRPRPLARTIHNSCYWHHWRRIGGWVERRMPPAHLAAVSRDALTAFADHRARTGGHAASTTLIFNGVDLPPARARAPRSAGARRRVLFAGRLEPQKGADLLPAILSQVRPPSAEPGSLTILGAGELAGVARQLAQRPPPGWTVELQPPRPDLAALLEDFDLVLMPSRFEGLSLFAAEVLVRGIPLIATHAPGLREMLPADYPWLAAPGDAADFARVFAQALARAADWDRLMLPAATRARAEFGLPRMAAAYARFYETILAPAAAPAPRPA